MQRHSIVPRPDWQKIVASQGLIYHTAGDHSYWNESACYSFTAQEVDVLVAATNKLHEMCFNAVQHVIDRDRFRELHIPAAAAELIKNTWENEPPAIYSRFDLAFDGQQIKLLEYNADTPTALLEAAAIQWHWLEDVSPKSDQFNSIHERLIAKWKELDKYLSKPLYFAHMEGLEDEMTSAYMRDTAEQAGIKTADLLIDEIGWNGRNSLVRPV